MFSTTVICIRIDLFCKVTWDTLNQINGAYDLFTNCPHFLTDCPQGFSSPHTLLPRLEIARPVHDRKLCYVSTRAFSVWYRFYSTVVYVVQVFDNPIEEYHFAILRLHFPLRTPVSWFYPYHSRFRTPIEVCVHPVLSCEKYLQKNNRIAGDLLQMKLCYSECFLTRGF